MNSMPDTKRELLRHTLGTLAYRGGKAVRDASEDFGSYRAGDSTRTPAEILAHIGDLLDWALWLAKGEHVWHDSVPLAWSEEVARFFARLQALEDYLSRTRRSATPPRKSFRGRLRTRSHTSGRSRSCAAWQVRLCAARATSVRTSPPVASGRSSPRRAGSSTDKAED